MDFSLLCPTRGRVWAIDQLGHMFNESITKNQSNVEILFATDVDDFETQKAVTHLQLKYPDLTISEMVRERSEYLNRDYYNWLAENSTGKYLWAIGDDVRILTYFWNIILKEKIEAYLKDKPDRIAYVSVGEVESKARHPCFPIITREAFKVLGEYHCSQLLSWGSDRILYEVYSGVNRMLHVPDVKISHISYHDGKLVMDATAISMKERFFRDPNCHNKVSENVVPGQIKKLTEYIRKNRVLL